MISSSLHRKIHPSTTSSTNIPFASTVDFAVQQLSGGTLAQALANADVQRTLANSSAYGVATKTESAIALEGVKAGSRVLHPMNAYHNIKKCGTGLSTVNCFSLRSHQFL
jgi:hypothetical protein